MYNTSAQSKIIDVLDNIRNYNLYVHNDPIENVKFNIEKFQNRPVFLVETLATINAIVKKGTMLLYGGHGGGKTTLSKYLGQVFMRQTESQVEKAILRGHPQLTEEKMLGSLNFKQILSPELISDDGDIDVRWNDFVKSEWKIIDEINRLSPYAQNILLSLLAEGVVKYQNQSYPVENYTVFATMNPPDEGNFDLPMPFMDRFALALPITMPDHTTLQTIGKMDDTQKREYDFSLEEGLLSDIRVEVENIKYDSDAEEFINNIISEYRLCDRVVKEASETITVDNGLCTKGSECRYLTTELPCSKIKTPLSVRVKQDLYKYGKALAWFLGYDRVETSHIQSLAPYMIWHRSNLSKQFLSDNLRDNFRDDLFSVNADLDSTTKIISLITKRYENRKDKILYNYKKALNAELNINDLEDLINKCEEIKDDLMVKKEILPALMELKTVYTKVAEYKKSIDDTREPRKLIELLNKLKREYSIQIRQQLAKQIETKINKIKIDKYKQKRYKVKIDMIEKIKSITIKKDSLRDFEKVTLSPPFCEYNLTARRSSDIVNITYQGPDDSEILNELEQLYK